MWYSRARHTGATKFLAVHEQACSSKTGAEIFTDMLAGQVRRYHTLADNLVDLSTRIIQYNLYTEYVLYPRLVASRWSKSSQPTFFRIFCWLFGAGQEDVILYERTLQRVAPRTLITYLFYKEVWTKLWACKETGLSCWAVQLCTLYAARTWERCCRREFQGIFAELLIRTSAMYLVCHKDVGTMLSCWVKCSNLLIRALDCVNLRREARCRTRRREQEVVFVIKCVEKKKEKRDCDKTRKEKWALQYHNPMTYVLYV